MPEKERRFTDQELKDNVRAGIKEANRLFDYGVDLSKTGHLPVCSDCAVMLTFENMTAEQCKGFALALLFFSDDFDQYINNDEHQAMWAHINHAIDAYKNKTISDDILNSTLIQ